MYIHAHITVGENKIAPEVNWIPSKKDVNVLPGVHELSVTSSG